MMKIEGQVLNASVEERELVGKDGAKRRSKISHVLMLIPSDDGKSQAVANVRAYDVDWELPKIGTKWVTSSIRKFECYDGNVAEIML